jgi:DsbC/DsbD-like thiol-disulfide interchange protein
MKNRIAILLTALLIFIGAATAASAQSVSVSGKMGPAKRGGVTKGTVTMNIPGGLHANSNRPGSEYAIPTTLKVSAKGATVNGVTYPAGRSRKFSFSDDTLNVYEGSKTFSFNVKVPANFKGKVLNITAVVRYQACTNEVCYAPASKTVRITANVN